MNLLKLLSDICKEGYSIDIRESFMPDTINIHLTGHGCGANYMVSSAPLQDYCDLDIANELLYRIIFELFTKIKAMEIKGESFK